MIQCSARRTNLFYSLELALGFIPKSYCQESGHMLGSSRLPILALIKTLRLESLVSHLTGWKPPSLGGVKANVDAAFKNGQAGPGVHFQN